MGMGRWDGASRSAYHSFSASTVGRSTDEIYRSRNMHADLDPKGVKVRESRDSDRNPESNPIIIALDVTGSMGMLADAIARQGLGILFESILDKKPVTDPHMMFMGVGDANCDRAPLQVSQFEADSVIIQQLTNLYLEKGGGGNNFESYNLPWYFGAFHTVHDAMEKRGKRGYLFTVGDEQAPGPLTQAQIKTFIGDDNEREFSTKETLELVRRVYDVYHIIIEEGSYARSWLPEVKSSWTELLGQQVISLSDHTKLAETIVCAIQVAEGTDCASAVGGWDEGTAKIVHDAVRHLPGPTS